MKISVITQAINDIKTDVLVVSAASTREQDARRVQLSDTASAVDKALSGLVSELFTSGEFSGRLGELLTIHPVGKLSAKRVIVVGLGALNTITSQSVRRASATAARHAQQTGAHSLTLALQWQNTPDFIQAEVEGALLGLYTFSRYKRSGQDADEKSIATIDVLAGTGADSAGVERATEVGRIMAEATNFSRDLVNEPPNVLTPTELANRAVAMAKQAGLDYEVFDKAKITELGMGGLLGVSQGSVEPPQFIILRYRGADAAEKGMALVGKGITFDTGGISLKPAANMDEMKGDMGGAAAVLGAMKAIAALKPHANVTALVPTCENMPSGSSYRPGDILRISNGKTIEIVNTDAEGRLILADALSYAGKQGLSPVIDLATLTGAVVVALGTITSGVFSNDEQLAERIVAAGRVTGEKFWAMPMDEEYEESIRSDVADVKQTGGRPAGAILAAKILEQFVSDGTHWAHLDIAGTSYLESKKSYQEKGGTGVGVRTLAQFVQDLSK